jgi:hypothetical protein
MISEDAVKKTRSSRRPLQLTPFPSNASNTSHRVTFETFIVEPRITSVAIWLASGAAGQPREAGRYAHQPTRQLPPLVYKSIAYLGCAGKSAVGAITWVSWSNNTSVLGFWPISSLWGRITRDCITTSNLVECNNIIQRKPARKSAILLDFICLFWYNRSTLQPKAQTNGLIPSCLFSVVFCAFWIWPQGKIVSKPYSDSLRLLN